MDREEKHAAGFEQVGDPLDLDFMDPPTQGKVNFGKYFRFHSEQ